MSGAADRDSLLLSFLEEEAPVLRLVFLHDGTLVEANAYACTVLGCQPGWSKATDVFVQFDDGLGWKRPLDLERPVLMTLNGVDGMPRSYTISAHRLDDQILILGRPDVEELEALRVQLVQLSNEVGNLNRDLHKKNVELERLNQLKNQFLGMAAHDLRKPVGAVMAYSEFLVDEVGDTLDEEHRRFLEVIARSGGRMRRLIDDFLDVAVIESGWIELEREPVELTDLMEAALRVVEVNAKRRGVSVRVEIPTNLPAVRVDGPKLEQVLMNLVDNSIEHCGAGTRVRISAAHDEGGLTLKLADDGPGIPAERLDTLFELTGERGGSKASGEKSLGLGLVIVKKLVEAHGGRIRVHSELGVGTEFTIEIPVDTKTEGEHGS